MASIFVNPYGGPGNNAINAMAAEIETAGARDKRIRHSMAMDALAEEAQALHNRAADPMRRAMDQGQVADWQAGYYRNNPQVREAQRGAAVYNAGTEGAAAGERSMAEYYAPGAWDMRRSQLRDTLSQIKARYITPELERTRRAGITGQSRADAAGITAAGRTSAAQTAGASRLAGNQIAAQPGSFDTATQWWENQTGGRVIPYSKIAQFARNKGITPNDAVDYAIAQNNQIDYSQ